MSESERVDRLVSERERERERERESEREHGPAHKANMINY